MAMHSRIIEVEAARTCAFQGDFENVVGIIYSNPYGKILEDEEIIKDLEAINLQPRGLSTEVEGESSSPGSRRATPLRTLPQCAPIS